jgi:phosphatidylglycerol---prolipoprotein diacylglyceryl transferase
VIASIPSPSFNSIEIGPLSLNLYGLMIALGVIAAVWLFGRRIQERGIGTPDDASAIGLVAVLAGVVGARLYHVITDWDRFQHDLAKIPAIWEGGLGIPGGLILGIPVGLWMAHRRGLPLATAATCAAPAIALAQAIGRWGNYFNQELYGRATDLPWALEIDNPLPGYAPGTTFHPTFLYESLWSLGLVLVLLWIDRRGWLRDGSLMAVYVIGYGIGRFWVEGLRIDRADELLGLRWNQWMALAAVVGGAIVLWWWEHRPLPPEPAAEDGVGSADADADGAPGEAPAVPGADGGHADGPGSAAEETFADQDRSADEEPLAEEDRSAAGERFADDDRSAAGERFADEDRSADEAVADEDRSADEAVADEDRSADEAVAGDGVEEVDR